MLLEARIHVKVGTFRKIRKTVVTHLNPNTNIFGSDFLKKEETRNRLILLDHERRNSSNSSPRMIDRLVFDACFFVSRSRWLIT